MASTFRSLYGTYIQLCENYAIVSATFAPMRLSRTELFILFARQSWRQLPRAMQITTVGTFVILSLYMVDAVVCRLKSVRRLGIPAVKVPKELANYNYHQVFKTASWEYRDRPYVYQHHNYEYVVFPASCFDEVKRLPRDQASNLGYFTKVMFSGWRFLGSETDAIHKSIGTDLTRALPVCVQSRQEETARAVRDALGLSSSLGFGNGPRPWKAVPLYWTALKMTVAANAQALVGPELGSSSWWLAAATAFPLALGVGASISQAFPRWTVRPLVAYLAYLPAWLTYAYMSHLLKPLAHKAMRDYLALNSNEAERRRLLQAAAGKPLPIGAWLMNRYRLEERAVSRICHDIIVLTFEAVPAISTSLSEQLLELAQRPALVDELRQEISSVMDANGHLPQTHLHELAKLDSFMRELSRYSPNTSLTLLRTLLKPTKLSLGPPLPTGTIIAVDACDIHASPRRWADPEVFDPQRFLKLRQIPGNETRYLYSTTGSDSPIWGDGKQACPGRVFATNTLKILLSHIIMHYDMRMVPGEKRPERVSMPNGLFAPNMFVKIEFRERA